MDRQTRKDLLSTLHTARGTLKEQVLDKRLPAARLALFEEMLHHLEEDHERAKSR